MSAAECRIHWFSSSLQQSAEEVAALIGGEWGPVEQGGPLFRPLKRVHETGASLHFSEEADVRPVLNLSGETCDNIAFTTRVVNLVRSIGGRCTRLDLAVDVGPPEEANRRVRQMRAAFEAGKVETRVKVWRWYESGDLRGLGDTGSTFVVGSPTSSHQLRAYDRRGLLRLEHQIRPKREWRDAVLGHLVALGGPVGLWRGYSRGLPFPHAWYRELLDGPTVEPSLELGVRCTMEEFVDVLRRQYGPMLRWLELFGYTLSDLGRIAPRTRGVDLVRLGRWIEEAEAKGLPVDKAREELRWRKSK